MVLSGEEDGSSLLLRDTKRGGLSPVRCLLRAALPCGAAALRIRLQPRHWASQQEQGAHREKEHIPSVRALWRCRRSRRPNTSDRRRTSSRVLLS
jgi:hypothetical protein